MSTALAHVRAAGDHPARAGDEHRRALHLPPSMEGAQRPAQPSLVPTGRPMAAGLCAHGNNATTIPNAARRAQVPGTQGGLLGVEQSRDKARHFGNSRPQLSARRRRNGISGTSDGSAPAARMRSPGPPWEHGCARPTRHLAHLLPVSLVPGAARVAQPPQHLAEHLVAKRRVGVQQHQLPPGKGAAQSRCSLKVPPGVFLAGLQLVDQAALHKALAGSVAAAPAQANGRVQVPQGACPGRERRRGGPDLPGECPELPGGHSQPGRSSALLTCHIPPQPQGLGPVVVA